MKIYKAAGTNERPRIILDKDMTDTKTEGTQLTDFSHLHELEERAKRTQSQMLRVQKNDAEWSHLAIQLFQTEQEIVDERNFLGLEDMDPDKLYAGLMEEHESEIVKKATTTANVTEQADGIRKASEALVAALTKESDDYDGLVSYAYAKEIADLQVALSRGWLSRDKADRPLREQHKEEERQALIAALAERSRLDPDAPAAIVFKESSDSEQLRNTQIALRNLYNAVQKSRAVNDPLGMATAMEEAGKWF